jgi:transposase
LHRLGIGVSDDTVLRQLKGLARDTAPTLRVVGIDDWSWRKSQTYGTIIVDLERRAVIDILAARAPAITRGNTQVHP